MNLIAAQPRLLARLRIVFGALLVLIAFAMRASATTIRVPQDQPTIQAGIGAAANGDTVLVSPGTYYENINFLGKAITVTSTDGATKTIIDGGKRDAVVVFKNHEARSSVLNGFTIQNGDFSASLSLFGSAGILLNSASATISNNIVTGNHCFGIYSGSSSPLIQGNEVKNTLDPNGDCTFGGGAAIILWGDLNTTLHSEVFGNDIHDNKDASHEDAGGNGGAIAVWGGAPLIQGNRIHDNRTWGGTGGGINLVSSVPITIVNNLIYRNEAGCGGGGIAFSFGTKYGYSAVEGFVSNNTIVDNTSTGGCGFTHYADASQVYLWITTSSRMLVNNIIMGASTKPLVGMSSYDMFDTASNLFDHNIILNSVGKGFSGVDPVGKYGNIAVDPVFVDRAGGDFHISASSPAADAGNNSALQFVAGVGGNTSTDVEGKPRVLSATGALPATIDIGAYEAGGSAPAAATTILLTPSAYSANGGTNVVLTAVPASVAGTPSGSINFYEEGVLLGSSAIAGGKASWTINKVTPGLHKYLATYDGLAGFQPGKSLITEVSVAKYGTTLTAVLTPSGNISAGQSLTIEYTVSASDGTIPSPIKVAVDSQVVATLTPDAQGKATYSTNTLAVGFHSITASVAEDAMHFGASTSSYITVVDPGITTTSLTVSPNPAVAGQPAQATVSVSAAGGATASGTVELLDGGTSLGTATLNAGVITFPLNGLTVGQHYLRANYNGDQTFKPSFATVQLTVVAPLTLTLTSSLNPSSFGQPVTFTASYMVGNGQTTAGVAGTLTIYDGTAVIFSGGNSSASRGAGSVLARNLSPGRHTIKAVYASLSTYGSIEQTLLQDVFSSAVVTVSANPTVFYALSGSQLSAQVTDASGGAAPTGSVQFLDGGVPLATVAISASGQATYALRPPLSAGPHLITVQYLGDTTHLQAVSSPLTLQVNGYPTTVTTAVPATAFAFQASTITVHVNASLAPTQPGSGTVTLFNGTAVLGAAAIDSSGNAAIPFSAPAGDYPLIVRYAASGPYLESASSPATVHVVADPTSVTLQSPAGKFYQHQNVPFTAAVSATHSAVVPSGNITLLEGTSVVGVAVVNNTGHVSIATSALTPGTHTLLAAYSPSGTAAPNFLPSSSAPITITIDASDFAITVAPVIDVPTEHHLDVTANLRSIGIYSGTVQVSCAHLPAHATCYFDHGRAATLSANSESDVAFWLETSDVKGYKAQLTGLSKAPLLALPLLPLLLLGRRRRRWLGSITLAIVLLAVAMASSGCSGLYPGYTPPGSYVIQVNATDGLITHSVDVTLRVSQ